MLQHRHLNSSKLLLKPLLLLAAMVLATAVQANTIYVDINKGSDSNPGTISLPLQNIGTAIAAANNQDTILVANGTYTGAANLNMDPHGKNFVLLSVGGPSNCIIDGGSHARAFLIRSGETNQLQIIGFTLQNCQAPIGHWPGNGGDGGAILITNSSPTIQQCVFVANRAGDGVSNLAGSDGSNGGNGGAVAIEDGASVLLNCVFVGNHAGDGADGFNGTSGGDAGNGGAVYIAYTHSSQNPSAPLFQNCVFASPDGDPDHGNRAGLAGNAWYDPSGFVPPGSHGGSGGAVCINSALTTVYFINCDIVGNEATSGGNPGSGELDGEGGGIYVKECDVLPACSVYNSILTGNVLNIGAGTPDFYVSSGLWSNLANSDVGSTGGDIRGGNNLSSSPLFVNSFADLHLLAGSPCIGTGSASAPYLPATDLDGNPRVVGGKVNMGAYSPTTAPVLSTLSPNSVAAGSAATLITITGKNFILNSGVQFNSNPIPTTYVSATRLMATIPASLLTTPGSAAITVVNPGPGGLSTNALPLKVVSNLSLTLNPKSVTGGATSTGTVTLTASAPTGGTTVTLSSGTPSVATVPASVTVAAGSKTATFTITSLPVTTVSTASISVSLSGVTQSATLTVNPAALSLVTLNLTSVTSGSTCTGTVALTASAPTGGTTVTLSSNTPSVATVPASVTVAAGKTYATFTVTSMGVATVSTASISATLGTVTKSVTLTVNPAALSSLTLNPTSVKGGATSTGTVKLTGSAPSGGSTITLSNGTSSVVLLPASVTVPAGSNTATFPVTTLTVAATNQAVISATLGTVTKTASLTLTQSPLNALVNGSFELPAITDFVYNPQSIGWTYAGTSGIAYNGSDFNNANAPNGVQVCFLQGSANPPGVISQSINFSAGTYHITLAIAARPSGSTPVQFSVDGVPVGAPLTPASASFANVTTASFTVKAGLHTITFAATNSIGDTTTFIDQVVLGH